MLDEQSRDDFFDGLLIFFRQILDFFPIPHQLFITNTRLAFLEITFTTATASA
jgi:hypothetical protein